MLTLFLTNNAIKMLYNHIGEFMIYVDLLVIEDLFMNYLVLLTTGILLNRITKFKKLFLASVIGTIPLIVLFIDVDKVLLIIINVLFAIIMSLIAFNYSDIIYTIKNTLYIYLISIFIAGSLYLINTSFFPNVNNALLNFVILIIFSPIVTKIYLKSINNIKTNYSNYYKVDIYFKDKPKITINGFLDTGNFLKDPYSHKPIILVSKNLVNITNEKVILVPYHTIDNQSIIKCFSPQKIHIDKIGDRNKVLLGLIDNINIEGADCILNKKLLERT